MKKIISFILTALLVLSLSMTAFAAEPENYGAKTEVSYELQDVYSISIPATYNVATEPYMEIFANYVHLSENKEIDVNIVADGVYYTGRGNGALYDGDKILPGSWLYGTTSDDVTHKISDSNGRIAIFSGDNGEIVKQLGGFLKFEPQYGAGTSCGDYSGTLYFSFEVKTLKNS